MSHSTSDIYDALAPYYREYAEKKTAYLSAVDSFILDNAPEGAGSLLDVGAGDGIRGMSIARQQGISRTVLCDLSSEMVARCQELKPTEVWQAAAEALPETNMRFEVITCLWNVLGHLAGREERIKALQRMGDLLAENGVIFFDVNNRHNASAYGTLKVLGRVILDTILPDERRGDARFDWKIKEKVFPAKGHLFTPAEIEGIIHAAGLQVKNRISVDYTTGEFSQSPFNGQLLYLVGK